MRFSDSTPTIDGMTRVMNMAGRGGRWQHTVPIAVAVVVLGAMGVRPHAAGAARVTCREPGDEPNAPGPRPPLPPRALVQLGTVDLRIRGAFITDIAFSPDGRLVAAAEANTEFPRVSVFDVQSGRLVKTIAPTVKPRGWVRCFAFSPDGTKLLWGEVMGRVASGTWPATRCSSASDFMEEGDWSRTWSSTRPPIAGRSTTWPSRPMAAWWPAPASTVTCGCGSIDRPAETFRDFTTPGRDRPAQWKARGARPLRPTRPGDARCLAFTPDGTRLGVASTTTISVWRIEDGQLVRRIERAHGDRPGARHPSIDSLAVTPDGRHVLSAGQITLPPSLAGLEGLPENVRRV